MGMEMSYSVDLIVKTLKKNRQNHITAYARAVTKYNKCVIQILGKKLALARQRKRVSHHINLPIPELYAGEYEKLIALFEKTSDTRVTLGTEDARKIFFDEWQWRGRFMSTTMCYSGPTGPTGATGSAGPTGGDEEGGDL